MTARALASPVSLVNNDIRGRLIEREKSLIDKTQQMLAAVKSQKGWNTRIYRNVIAQARARLSALQAGLLPVRLGGRHFRLAALLNEGQYIPSVIVAKAEEAGVRFPDAEQRVYGWDHEALPQERRRRDPVLTMFYGGAEFFLGFWLEVAVADESVPEFFGLTAPLLPKPGRGRPRKIIEQKR